MVLLLGVVVVVRLRRPHVDPHGLALGLDVLPESVLARPERDLDGQPELAMGLREEACAGSQEPENLPDQCRPALTECLAHDAQPRPSDASRATSRSGADTQAGTARAAPHTVRAPRDPTPSGRRKPASPILDITTMLCCLRGGAEVLSIRREVQYEWG